MVSSCPRTAKERQQQLVKEKWSEILGWMLTLCKFKLKGLSIFFFLIMAHTWGLLSVADYHGHSLGIGGLQV